MSSRPAKEMRPVTRHIGPRLRRHREARHLSLERVAEGAHITLVALHNLETGKASSRSDTFERVAEAIGVDYGLILYEARLDAERQKRDL